MEYILLWGDHVSNSIQYSCLLGTKRWIDDLKHVKPLLSDPTLLHVLGLEDATSILLLGHTWSPMVVCLFQSLTRSPA